MVENQRGFTSPARTYSNTDGVGPYSVERYLSIKRSVAGRNERFKVFLCGVPQPRGRHADLTYTQKHSSVEASTFSDEALPRAFNVPLERFFFKGGARRLEKTCSSSSTFPHAHSFFWGNLDIRVDALFFLAPEGYFNPFVAKSVFVTIFSLDG